MRKAILTRGPSTDQGTFGSLRLDSGRAFSTGELPWKNNEHGVSCIPTGVYVCKMIDSPKHGPCYEVTDVPQRDCVEIHSANFMGDKSKGYYSQLLGCIALGEAVGMLEGQMAVLRSRPAIEAFENDLNGEDFELTIR